MKTPTSRALASRALDAARQRHPLSADAIGLILAAYATEPAARTPRQAAIVDLLDRATRRRAGLEPGQHGRPPDDRHNARH